MRLMRHRVPVGIWRRSRRNWRKPREPERSSPFEGECPKEGPLGRTSLKTTQRGIRRSKSTQRGVGRSKSTQCVFGFLGDSYGCPSAVDEGAQTDIASSVSFGEAPVQKNRTLHGQFTKTIRRRYTGQQPGTKSARRPADKRQIHHGATAGFALPSVYIGFPLFVLPETCPGGFSSIVWRLREAVVSLANRPVGVPSASRPRPAAPPSLRAPPRPDLPVVCPGLGLDRFI